MMLGFILFFRELLLLSLLIIVVLFSSSSALQEFRPLVYKLVTSTVSSLVGKICCPLTKDPIWSSPYQNPLSIALC